MLRGTNSTDKQDNDNEESKRKHYRTRTQNHKRKRKVYRRITQTRRRWLSYGEQHQRPPKPNKIAMPPLTRQQHVKNECTTRVIRKAIIENTKVWGERTDNSNERHKIQRYKQQDNGREESRTSNYRTFILHHTRQTNSTNNQKMARKQSRTKNYNARTQNTSHPNKLTS